MAPIWQRNRRCLRRLLSALTSSSIMSHSLCPPFKESVRLEPSCAVYEHWWMITAHTMISETLVPFSGWTMIPFVAVINGNKTISENGAGSALSGITGWRINRWEESNGRCSESKGSVPVGDCISVLRIIFPSEMFKQAILSVYDQVGFHSQDAWTVMSLRP